MKVDIITSSSFSLATLGTYKYNFWSKIRMYSWNILVKSLDCESIKPNIKFLDYYNIIII